MPDLADGQSVEIQGSAARPYIIKNTGSVFSCSCPAWRNQSLPIERRTCKHLRKLRGDVAEEARLGGADAGDMIITLGAGSVSQAGEQILEYFLLNRVNRGCAVKRRGLHSPVVARLSLFAIGLICISYEAPVASAQVLYGSIVGTVTDQASAVVPKAAVTIRNAATGLSRQVNTDDKTRVLRLCKVCCFHRYSAFQV